MKGKIKYHVGPDGAAERGDEATAIASDTALEASDLLPKGLRDRERERNEWHKLGDTNH
jgi:hypothetical protein